MVTRAVRFYPACQAGRRDGSPALPSTVVPPEVHWQVASSLLSEEDAETIAERLVEERRWSPFAHVGDIVPRVFHPDEEEVFLEETVVKGHREAAVRTLAEMGNTRTWNILIDVVAQTGRFTEASEDGSGFLVTGERRYWVHAAVDRITGEVIDLRKEPVAD